MIVSLTGDGANLTYTLQDDGNLTTIFYGSETAVFVSNDLERRAVPIIASTLPSSMRSNDVSH